MKGLRCDCRHSECPCSKKRDGQPAGPRCVKAAVGSVGMVRFCFSCIGWLTGREASSVDLRRPMQLDLHDDGVPVSTAVWQPDVADGNHENYSRSYDNSRGEPED